MKGVLKTIPKFKSEKDERDFWLTHDTTDYFDMTKAIRAEFPNLKPSSKTINIRIPENLLNDIKIQANKTGVPYQSYIKFILVKNHGLSYTPKARTA